jgi:hypothetical protein
MAKCQLSKEYETLANGVHIKFFIMFKKIYYGQWIKAEW